MITAALRLEEGPFGRLTGYMLITPEGPLHCGRRAYRPGRTYSIRGAIANAGARIIAGIPLYPLNHCLRRWLPGATVLVAETKRDLVLGPHGSSAANCRWIRIIREMYAPLVEAYRVNLLAREAVRRLGINVLPQELTA